jgi:hypothetical protein
MIFRYVRHQSVLGDLGYDSQWAVLMQWLCDCRCVESTPDRS